MKEDEFLDRKLHYCKHCKKSFSTREVKISSVYYPSGTGKIVLGISCPLCHHRIRSLRTSHRKIKKVLEDYLRERNMEIDGQ